MLTTVVKKNVTGRKFILPLVAVAALSGLRAAPVHAADPTYSYFPTASVTDGRMLAVAGEGLSTLANTKNEIRIVVSAGLPSFDIGFFDGDTGKDSTGAINVSNGHWDSGPSQAIYSLYADPAGDGSGAEVASNLIGSWTGNDPNPLIDPNHSNPLWSVAAESNSQPPSPTMPDNDWWDVTVTPSAAAKSSGGAYVYTLVTSLQDPATATESCFKLRSTAIMGISPLTWAFDDALLTIPDASIIYPGLTSNDFFVSHTLPTTTTYDGTWTFYFSQPVPTANYTIWDGDFDSGTTAHPHQPDPDTVAFGPTFIPSFAAGTNAFPASPTISYGNPQDLDTTTGLFGRAPGVQYSIQDPLGNVYLNQNPSSNQFWEQFKITTDPSATRNDADYGPGFISDAGGTVNTGTLPGGLLPAGVWQMNIIGLDASNTCFLHPNQYALGVGTDGKPSTAACQLSNVELWPPNHDLVNIGNIALAPGMDPSEVSVKVYSNEPDVPTSDCGDDHGKSGSNDCGDNGKGGDDKSKAGDDHGKAGDDKSKEHCDSSAGNHPQSSYDGKDQQGSSDNGGKDCNSGGGDKSKAGDDKSNAGDDHFSPDAKVTSTSNQISVQVRSERLGCGDGRVYLIVVTTTDPSGIPMVCVSYVTVPHDQSKKSLADVAADAAAAEAYFNANGGAIPPGYVQVGVGPVIGPKQ